MRVDASRIPGAIMAMFPAQNAALRSAWTLSERIRELIRLYSANEQRCLT